MISVYSKKQFLEYLLLNHSTCAIYAVNGDDGWKGGGGGGGGAVVGRVGVEIVELGLRLREEKSLEDIRRYGLRSAPRRGRAEVF
ncbi:hypothetical protein QVD17_16175 [Tagetes erecta]|uniref:Uncharacterized protein n=1 Tax=Tagetes erecta TaxID=13708 RepID=A0AAD8P0G2_TARER|nr:hypothetical protein QVD17_16175 [Tagetes erecta]